jgi:hypothetical protein
VRDSGQQSNSELTRLGPASARRPGPQQGEGFSAHLALWTWWRGGRDEQRGMAWSRGSRAARSMASTATSSLCSSPAPWRSGEVANSTVKRKQAVRLGEGATPASSSGFRRRRRPSAAQAGGLNSSGSAVHARASPVRRPHLQAGRRLGGPAAQRLRAPPWAASSSPLPQLLLLPLSSSLLAVDREKSPKRRRRHTVSKMGIFIGRR